MRRLLSLSICVLLASGLNAQHKGDWSVNLAAGGFYDHSFTSISKSGNGTTEKTTSSGISAITGISTFVSNHSKLSVQAEYGFNSNKPAGNGTKNSTSLFSVGPSYSYYVKLTDKLYLTPEVGAFYSFGKSIQRITTVGYTLTSSLGDQTESITTIDVYDCNFRICGVSLTAALFSLEFKPSERIGINVSFGQIGFAYLTGKDDKWGIYIDDSSTTGLYLNSNAMVGLSFYL